MKKMRIFVLMLVVLFTVAITACVDNGNTNYTITFDANGGTPATQTVSTDGKTQITLPTTPTNNNLEFGGWFFDKDIWENQLTPLSLISNPITQNTTVYALWLTPYQPIDITVVQPTYNGGDLYFGDALPTITTTTTGGTIALNANQQLIVGSHQYDWTFTPNADSRDNYLNTTGKITLIVQKATQTLPTSITLDATQITFNSITLTDLGNDYEYSCDPSLIIWQDLNIFTDLEPQTSYTFYARIKETATHSASNRISVELSTIANPTDSYFVMDGTILVGLTTQGKQQTELTIPDKIAGVEVRTISALAFSECPNLTKLTISSATRTIAKGALSGLSLTHLTVPFLGESLTSNEAHFGWFFGADTNLVQGELIPSSLTNVTITMAQSIASSAFLNCKSLQEVTLPSTVTAMGTNIFAGCNSLKQLTLPYVGGILGALFGATSVTQNETLVPASLKTINVLNPANIPADAFKYCKQITTINIPEGVTTIGQGAFVNCESLVNFVIPQSVTTIAMNAFANCFSLTKIVIPNSVKSLGVGAFLRCTSLNDLTIGNGIKRIEGMTFAECSSLTIVNIPEGIEFIADEAFSYCNKITDIYLPFSLEELEGGAFAPTRSLVAFHIPEDSFRFETIDGILFSNGGEKLIAYPTAKPQTSYSIPLHVTAIELFAFDENRFLQTLTITKNVTSIGNSAFDMCDSLTQVIFDSEIRLEYIPIRAFQKCLNLTTVNIPASVILIGLYAFDGCISLTNLTFDPNSKLQTIDAYAFRYLPMTAIEFPKSLVTIGMASFKFSLVQTVTFQQDSMLDSIGQASFSDCEYLVSIQLPLSLTSIEPLAFMRCYSLQSIHLPANVQLTYSYNGTGQFTNCPSLATITVDPNNPYYIVEDNILFSKNMEFLHVYAPAQPKTQYTIPNEVLSIGSYAFRATANLTQVTLSDNLLNIYDFAFDGASLTEIFIPINVEYIGNGVFNGCEDLVISLERATPHPDWHANWNKIDKDGEIVALRVIYNATKEPEEEEKEYEFLLGTWYATDVGTSSENEWSITFVDGEQVQLTLIANGQALTLTDSHYTLDQNNITIYFTHNSEVDITLALTYNSQNQTLTASHGAITGSQTISVLSSIVLSKNASEIRLTHKLLVGTWTGSDLSNGLPDKFWTITFTQDKQVEIILQVNHRFQGNATYNFTNTDYAINGDKLILYFLDMYDVDATFTLTFDPNTLTFVAYWGAITGDNIFVETQPFILSKQA